MKICFLHYYFKNDGVTRSVLNHVKGLKELSNDIEFVFAGESFDSSLPEEIEKQYVNFDTQDILSQLQEISTDADIIIIENPVVGTIPLATLAFKEFSENTDKKIIYRIHDFIDDRPHLFEEFKKTFDDFESIYPQTDNVSFITLTNTDKERLIQKGLKNVNVIPNSIIISDFSTTPEKPLKLRETFEEQGIIESNEKIISYPVRVLKRKNIEEAMLLTKILNLECPYRLIVTVPLDKEYEKEILDLAEKYNIPCSIGQAVEYISFDKKDDFTITDLYKISDLVVSTSITEGFGFAFVEPWLAETPVIGRKISSVTEDFVENGIDLNHLYDNDVIHNSKHPEERMSNVHRILSNPTEFSEIARKLEIKDRIQKASEVIEKNKKAIEEYYDHVNIAKKLLSMMTI